MNNDEGAIQLDTIKAALIPLTGKIDAAITRMERQEVKSQGRKKEVALRILVDQLHDIFKMHYQGDKSKWKEIGTFTYKSVQSTQEFNFIRAAILASKIVNKKGQQILNCEHVLTIQNILRTSNNWLCFSFDTHPQIISE